MTTEHSVTVVTPRPLRCIGSTCLSQGQIIAFLICDILLAIVILTGNVLVISSVIRTPALQTKNNVLLASLALADFMMAAICIPLDIVAALGFKPDISAYTCLSLSALIGSMVFVTVFHICAIAFDRYLAITSPLTYHQTMTKLRVAALIAFVWLLTLVLGGVTFIRNNTSQFQTSCDLLYIQAKEYRMSVVVICIITPFTLMSFMYYRIFIVARSHRRRIAALERLTESNPMARDHNFSRMKRDLKAAMTLILVFGVFIFGWTPATFMTAIDFFIPDIRIDEIYVYELMCFKIAFSNSAMNPMIYAARNEEFRQAFVRQLSVIFRCRSWERFTRDRSRTEAWSHKRSVSTLSSALS
ncbi:adenosine receptor A2b-like [Diadema antillarum]|uniref:adenosine receptor A2b-like n=1 Tax=Diadema antillarum TaxID=105358 RepID=UPI003A857B39